MPSPERVDLDVRRSTPGWHVQPMRGLLAWTALAMIVVVGHCGCSQSSQQQDPLPPELPFKGVQLTLAVVDDPQLAAAARDLTGEWKAVTGATFKVIEVQPKGDWQQTAARADAVMASSARIATMAAGGKVLPLPDDWLKNGQLGWSETFELLETHEASFGQQVIGLPMGSPTLLMYHRADLLKSRTRPVPATWDDYSALAAGWQGQPLPNGADGQAAGKADSDTATTSPPPTEFATAPQPRYGSLQPLGPGWAAITLLARSASYAGHRGQYSVLFDIQSMRPLIARPPFVKALEQLAADYRAGPQQQLEYSPADVQRAFLRGESLLAIGWPVRAFSRATAGVDHSATTSDTQSPAAAAGSTNAVLPVATVGVGPLPGTAAAYNQWNGSWEPLRDGETGRVTLVAIEGRLAAVTAASKHPQAAFELLVMITGKEWADRVCSTSQGTMLFRAGQVAQAKHWLATQPEELAALEARQLASTLELSHGQACLRIPGRERYLAVLDDAVRRVARGELQPRPALQQVAEAWDDITAELGIESQRAAYLQSVGLEN